MSSPHQNTDQIADQKCFLRTVAAFRNYETAATRVCEKRRQDWKSGIPDGHRELLEFAIAASKKQQQQQQQQKNGENNNDGDDDQKKNNENNRTLLSKFVKEFKPSTTSSAPSQKSVSEDADNNNDNDDSGNSNSNNNQKQKPSSSSHHQAWSPQHFETQLYCIGRNQDLLSEIADIASEDLFDDYFPNKDPRARGRPLPRPRNFGNPSHLDQDKVFSTLRQIVRDWSKEGAYERKEVYDYFYESLEKAHPDPKKRNEITVLVPGGGLSRLMVEIAARGFSARGNEFSYHMLMSGHFIMNHIQEKESVTIFPYCDIALNHWARDLQFQAISFPDQSAMEMFQSSEKVHKTNGHGDLSMVAGDFVEVFMKPEEKQQWNAIASCFFLDTAHNIVEYLQVIHQCLVPGGLLINVGPLLYHWADAFEDVSIELSYDELKNLLWVMGFEIIDEKVVKTNYTNNSNAMKQNFYQCPAFVAKKVEPKYNPQGSMEIDPDRYYAKKMNDNNNTNNNNRRNNNNTSNNNNNRRNNNNTSNNNNNTTPAPAYSSSPSQAAPNNNDDNNKDAATTDDASSTEKKNSNNNRRRRYYRNNNNKQAKQ